MSGSLHFVTGIAVEIALLSLFLITPNENCIDTQTCFYTRTPKREDKKEAKGLL